MTSLVIDSKVILSWLFRDAVTLPTDLLFTHVCDHGAMVPANWHLEVAHHLLTIETARRIKRRDTDKHLELLSEFSISVDPETVGKAWHNILDLARAGKISPHQAAYLELAKRYRIALATKDKSLSAAALKLQIPLFFIT
jgi:predicted nucleic acid-binding protein